ncbi:hypothetical protein QBC44DRAFT_355924 [Cladorrhinum sp. PSN332]|nr:hypothetical protein QBC44DRAFT_355924 [Cladorrhinum sp. PSN332]
MTCIPTDYNHHHHHHADLNLISTLPRNTILHLTGLLRCTDPIPISTPESTTTTTTTTTTLLISASWLAEQKRVIIESGNTLPKEILSTRRLPQGCKSRWRLGSLLKNITVVTNKHRGAGVFPFLPLPAGLCEAHRGLNEDLIKSIFALVRVEVCERNRSVRSYFRYLRRMEKHQHKHQQNEWEDHVKHCLETLSSVAALCIQDDETYKRLFGRSVAAAAAAAAAANKMGRVKNGCPACVLSVIGGNKEVLVGLRASCVARARGGRRVPRLLKVLRGWIAHFGQREGCIMERRGGELAERINQVRKLERERRRRKRRKRDCFEFDRAVEEEGQGGGNKGGNKGGESEEGEEDDDYEDAEEGECIPVRKHWDRRGRDDLESEILLDRPRPEEYAELGLGVGRESWEPGDTLGTEWDYFV